MKKIINKVIAALIGIIVLLQNKVSGVSVPSAGVLDEPALYGPPQGVVGKLTGLEHEQALVISIVISIIFFIIGTIIAISKKINKIVKVILLIIAILGFLFFFFQIIFEAMIVLPSFMQSIASIH